MPHFKTTRLKMLQQVLKKSSFGRILCLTFVVILLFMLFTSTNGKSHRTRRTILFTKSSKFFFRVNDKYAMFNRTDLFSHAWGIRVNYEMPHTMSRRRRMFTRDIHREIEAIPIKSLRETFSCLIKNMCESFAEIQSAESCGFYCQLGNIIKRSTGIEAQFFKSFVEKCDYHSDTCPGYSKDIIMDRYA